MGICAASCLFRVASARARKRNIYSGRETEGIGSEVSAVRESPDIRILLCPGSESFQPELSNSGGCQGAGQAEECPALGFGCSEHPGTSCLSAPQHGFVDALKASMLYPNLQPALMQGLLVSPSPPSPAASYTWRDEGCRFGTMEFSPSPSAVLTAAAPGVQPMCKLCGREAGFVCSLHRLVGTLFT